MDNGQRTINEKDKGCNGHSSVASAPMAPGTPSPSGIRGPATGHGQGPPPLPLPLLLAQLILLPFPSHSMPSLRVVCRADVSSLVVSPTTRLTHSCGMRSSTR